MFSMIDRVTQTENGIYTVNASGAPTRATDADTGTEMAKATVQVELGTVNANTQWTCNTATPITLGSDNITFVNAGTSVYVAGTGLLLTGNSFSVVDSTSIQKINVLDTGSLIGTQSSINFIAGSNTTLSVVDNPGSSRVDVTIGTTAASGDVTGPASATDLTIPVFDGTTGKLIKDGTQIKIDASHEMYRTVTNSTLVEGGGTSRTTGAFSEAAGSTFAGAPGQSGYRAVVGTATGAVDTESSFRLTSFNGTTWVIYHTKCGVRTCYKVYAALCAYQ